MSILVALIFLFGVYAFINKLRGKELPPEAREFSKRLGRSAHASFPLPGVMGQAPASMMPERAPDEIGPESSHIVVIKGPERPWEHEPRGPDLEEIRARLDAIAPLPRPKKAKARRKRATVE